MWTRSQVQEIGITLEPSVETFAMPTEAALKANYSIKNIEMIAKGVDVQARIFTLAPGEVIPWHRHSESTDHYFILRGTLTASTRNPDDERTFEIGGRHRITPGTPHLISNRGTTDCQFLLVQGVGRYDFIKSEG
jgi:quercetin dioxygenase-like cupin family protein